MISAVRHGVVVLMLAAPAWVGGRHGVGCVLGCLARELRTKCSLAGLSPQRRHPACSWAGAEMEQRAVEQDQDEEGCGESGMSGGSQGKCRGEEAHHPDHCGSRWGGRGAGEREHTPRQRRDQRSSGTQGDAGHWMVPVCAPHYP